jgi:molybdopterin synthase catalytic subunit
VTAIANIFDGALSEEAVAESLAAPIWRAGREGAQTGALVRFDGIVRRMEPDATGEGRPLAALDYRTYDPMAERELAALARRTLGEHGLLRIAALHSRGRVDVGATSFILIVEAAHRKDALAAMTAFIEALKRDVPIWKHPVWA